MMKVNCQSKVERLAKYLVSFALCSVLAAGCGSNEKPKRSQQAGGKTQTRKVLIVTGIDHPAHKWHQTAPALAKVLAEDPRLKVDVVDEPEHIASPDIHSYDLLVIHFMNWQKPPLGPQQGQNLQKFLYDGKGLFILHFGCGAFRDWPEYRNIAGRVWDPNARAHDPKGTFHVDVINKKHPITMAMQSFDTDDELYTCLTGDKPIEVLATARSKVDEKVYPMAFVCNYGRGRVFHCALGHDVKAIENPPVAELFRRGCAWAAGL